MTKRKLKRQYAKLNPAALKRQILDIQELLYKKVRMKSGLKGAGEDESLVYVCLK